MGQKKVVWHYVFPVHVLAAGWWYGRYWVMVDGGTCLFHPILWFDTALEALAYIGESR